MIRDCGTLSGIPPSGNRNKRSVWTFPTQATPEAHFATYPTELVKPCILAKARAKAIPSWIRSAVQAQRASSPCATIETTSASNSTPSMRRCPGAGWKQLHPCSTLSRLPHDHT